MRVSPFVLILAGFVVWSIAFQWYAVTGGDNGILGIWDTAMPAWLATREAYFLLTLGLAACGGPEPDAHAHGEGGDDQSLMPWLSSASIACGFHAGGPGRMRDTVALCLRHGVAIGAHPSFDDRANFGRTEQSITPADAHALVSYQIGALAGIARAQSVRWEPAAGTLALELRAGIPAELRTVVAVPRDETAFTVIEEPFFIAATSAGSSAAFSTQAEVSLTNKTKFLLSIFTLTLESPFIG